MGTISVSDCTVKVLSHSGLKVIEIVTPATADDGDTIDVSTYFEYGCFAMVYGASDAVVVSAASYTGKSITLPGGTDDEARYILAMGR